MKTSNYSINKYLILISVACLLLSPFLSEAKTSSVYNEIITTSNSGESINTNSTANVEVTNTTIINGERSTYHYVTSTDNSLEHDVIIIHNPPNEPKIISEKIDPPTLSETNIFDSQKLPTASTSSTTRTSYKLWSQIENVLNYLYFYVEKLF